jgi:hypothetical protein
MFVHQKPGFGSGLVFSQKCGIRIQNQCIRIRSTGYNEPKLKFSGPYLLSAINIVVLLRILKNNSLVHEIKIVLCKFSTLSKIVSARELDGGIFLPI